MYLNVHSHYSLRYGTMSVKTLVAQAAHHGVSELALTDINNSTGIMEFMRECDEVGIKPIGGIEFRRGKQLLYVGIARNKEGMKELNDFLTFHNLRQQVLPDRPGLFKHALVIYPFCKWPGDISLENEFLGISYQDLHALHGRKLGVLTDRLVVLQPVFVKDKVEYRLHEYLRAIDLNSLITMVGPDDKCAAPGVFLAPSDLEERFSQHPFIIENTKRLIEGCVMDYVRGKVRRNKQTFTGSKAEDRKMLDSLAIKGVEERYGQDNHRALEKVRDELRVIHALDFCAYFLITWDIIRYSTSQGYYHVGRGSGANSTVAYCLRITDVDPLELDLYFERFLNAQRSSPPDFDLDFSWDEREDVQRYIFDRYGREHTALLGTMSTFKDRSVIREIGKVMGLPKSEIDGFNDPAKARENRDNQTFKKIMAIYGMMQDMPNQRSIHAGGILISEEPITYYTALDLPPKGMPTVQWDMYEAEAIGFDKYDILSQRGIGHIKEAVHLVKQNQGISIDLHAVKDLMKDPNLNNNLKTGDTVGCFYIESPAMRQLLTKLGCGDYLTLVAASSIIRPGVAQSGMMKTYIQNYHAPDRVNYLHPIMKDQLKETFGVMVYQEDVIKICMHYAGMNGEDADVLRRGMSGKYRSRVEFDKLVDKFHDGARMLGRPESITREVWRQVSSFAGYSFSKAHSASFAVESYQSLHLKTYYPKEFMVAVLNNYGGFYNRALYVQALQKAGAKVYLPCVNESKDTVSITGEEVWLGFIGVQGLEGSLVELIPTEVRLHGAFADLEDFLKRTGCSLVQATILIRVGAFRFTGKSKKALLWEVHMLFGGNAKRANHAELFHIERKSYALPELVSTQLEDAYHELELLGFPLSLSMLDLLRTNYRGDVLACDLKSNVGKIIKMVGQYVCEKSVTMRNGGKMWFGTFLDAKGDFFDTTHFPANAPDYPFRGAGCYLILGKVTVDFGFPSIDVQKFAKLPIIDNPVME
jgi:DNA-directed DNA polymerase III PolC